MYYFKLIKYGIIMYFQGIKVDIARAVFEKKLKKIENGNMKFSDAKIVRYSKFYEKALFNWKDTESKYFKSLQKKLIKK